MYRGKIFRDRDKLFILTKCNECVEYHAKEVKGEMFRAWEERKFFLDPTRWDLLKELINEYRASKTNSI